MSDMLKNLIADGYIPCAVLEPRLAGASYVYYIKTKNAEILKNKNILILKKGELTEVCLSD